MGWYPDPLGAREHRFWDGERWANKTAGEGRRDAPSRHRR
ncbi:MAG: DUF2510 domain-containing protein [Actinobacteria bacterium]|nr:DUF2510 domain-containing protein [Actinomycetota bacterium]MBS1884738.1 DUF2510 domain-containing protein [Actinomycetota bacterium]